MVKEVKRTGTTASEIEVTREILDELKIKGYISQFEKIEGCQYKVTVKVILFDYFDIKKILFHDSRGILEYRVNFFLNSILGKYINGSDD